MPRRSNCVGAQALLDVRVAALSAGDRDAFLATVDPQAPKSFLDAQSRSFDGLHSLPLAGYALEARLDDSGDLGGKLSADYGGAKTFLPETRQRMRFRDYDDRDAVDSLWLTFVQRDGKWFVGGDNDLSALGIDTFRGSVGSRASRGQAHRAFPRAESSRGRAQGRGVGRHRGGGGGPTRRALGSAVVEEDPPGAAALDSTSWRSSSSRRSTSTSSSRS